MENNNSDKFQITAKDYENNENFFLSESVNDVQPTISQISEPTRRLNDYDFNLLKEDAYKDVSDDLFKLEYKISKIEKEILELDSQIQATKDIRDFNSVEELLNRKNTLLEDKEALIAIYNEKSLSAKITDSIFSFWGKDLKNKMGSFNQKITDFSEKLLSKMPSKFSSILELKKSLNKLENINKSVDELMSMNIPYGENYDKYEQLSKYIIKANSIQNDISKFMK
jgi:hypothetical protein